MHPQKNSPFTILKSENLKDISSELLLPNGKLKLLPASYYENIDKDNLRFFCHKYGRYGLPTIELVDFISKEIDGRSAIEIGAGHGDLGYHLNIKMTDLKIQKNPEVKEYYKIMKQPIIEYPNDVKKLEASEAVNRYKPEVIIASWITTYSPSPTYYMSSPYGIKESEILEKVKTFIIIGNKDLHNDKPICRIPHFEKQERWIVSRAANPQNNCIYIWNK